MKLSEHYTITSNSDMSYYLGYDITRDRTMRSMILSQRAYMHNLEMRYDVPADVIYPSTPMEYVNIISLILAKFLMQLVLSIFNQLGLNYLV